MFTSSVAVLAILCLLIFLAYQMAKHPWGKQLSAALIVIVLGAILANFGIIPTASNAIPLYDAIFTYIAPVSIFYLVLRVNLNEIRKAGLPMISLFLIGSAGTVIGVLIAYYLTSPANQLGEFAGPIAGMLTGTYTGGSLNFNAVALHYKVNEQGTLFAGSVAVDNVLTAVWIVVTIAVPRLLMQVSPVTKPDAETISETTSPAVSEISFQELLVLIPLGLFAYLFSDWLNGLFPAVPMILIITSLGLLLAQFKFFHQMSSCHYLGLYLVYLFLVVIGAYCELDAISSLGEIGLTLTIFFSLAILVHGLIIMSIGRLISSDWVMIAIASQANVGGGTSAMALAETFDREELIVPAILVGTLGNAMGTYLGFMVAGILS